MFLCLQGDRAEDLNPCNMYAQLLSHASHACNGQRFDRTTMNIGLRSSIALGFYQGLG